MIKISGARAALCFLFSLLFIACNKKDSTDSQIEITGQWKLDSMLIKQYKNDQLIQTGTSVTHNYLINFNTDGTYSETVNGKKDQLGIYRYKKGDDKITFTSDEITGDVPITKLTNNQLNFWVNSINNNSSQTEYDRQEAYFFLSR